jgi:protease-4
MPSLKENLPNNRALCPIAKSKHLTKRFLKKNRFMRVKKVLTLLFLGLILTGFQTINPQSPSEDTLAEQFLSNPNLPFDSTSTADDITSTYFNPAGIGVHPLQIGVFYANNDEDQLNDYLLFLNLFGFAFAAQWRQAESGFNAQRLTIGTGIETSNTLSIGTTYNWYHSSASILNDYAEWDIGVIFRPWRHLSFGAVARGLNLPVFQTVQIKPRFDTGISIRPIPKYSERLTLSADVIFYLDNRQDDIVPRFTLEAVPFHGLTVYGGTSNFQDVYFGMKFSQNITQISFQASKPENLGWFFGGGVLVGQERFKTSFEAINHYLEIPLDENYQELKKPSVFFLPESAAFYDLLAAIEQAAKDPQINGIIIKADNFRGGWGQAEEIRNALLKFQENSGKPVYAFITQGSNKDYFIATGAQKIIMPPAGTLALTGLKAEVYYLKGLFDMLGIEPDFITMGEYKSAPNTFTKTQADKYEKEQIFDMLNSIQYEFKRAILSRRRNLTSDQLEKIFNEGIYTVTKAKTNDLVDDVMYYSEIRQKYLKISPNSLINWKIDLKSYLKSKIYDDNWGIKPAIALLTLEGEITEKENLIPFLGASSNINLASTVKMLEKIRTNPAIRSVVIRINSPGGSGIASDIIWEEIRLLQKDKPVIISIGDTAASGGYYIAAGADQILADQTSITGSIGVFSGKFSLKNLYKKLGVHKEIFKLNDKGSIFSETSTFTEEEKKVLLEQMNEFYELFIKRVQRSRTNLSKAEIENNAKGRVYTGSEARKRGMVDEIGGLALALEIAKKKGKLSDEHMAVMLFPGSGENILGNNNIVIPLPNSIKNAIGLLINAGKIGSENEVLLLMPYEYDIK